MPSFVQMAAQKVKLQDGGVERVSDLVGQIEGQRAHRRDGLGVRSTLLEGATLRNVDSEAVDERGLVGSARGHRQVPPDAACPRPPELLPRFARRNVDDTARDE